VAGVIGDPVHHSLSPVLHNAAYRAMGLDWVYVALPVPAGRAAAAIDAMRTLGLVGLSVTMPHKAAVAAAVDRLAPTARRLGVVNTVTRVGDALVGDSTDGAGFVDALRSDLSWSPAGRRCVVLGTGGAARAVVLALAEAGAAEVRVVGRRPDAVIACVGVGGPSAGVGAVSDARGADLVVNATPVGMAGHPASLPFDLPTSSFGRGQVVVDLVYVPAVTPLMAAARHAGAIAANGLGMLVHQAARQIAAWTGEEAPRQAMTAAAHAFLDGRAQD
jgi:shikimate dehydrogenase